MELFIKLKTYLLTILISLFSISNTEAAYFWVGLGTVTHNFKSAQTDSVGEKTKTLDMTPTILVGASMPAIIFNSTLFSPAIGYAKYFDLKDGYTKNEIILQYHFTYSFNSWFDLRYGFSNYITRIGGKGGSVSLNNGSSMTSFYVPSKTKSSYTASLDIAPEFVILNNLTLRTQLSIERFASSERRTLAHLITLNYFL